METNPTVEEINSRISESIFTALSNQDYAKAEKILSALEKEVDEFGLRYSQIKSESTLSGRFKTLASSPS